jgi:oxygen-independent coproporphyrinogen-3 oxidase
VHDAEHARNAVQIARDGGITAFSLDLIFSLPEFLARDWRADLEAALALDPDHVSLYGLTIEPDTPLGKWSARGDVVESPEERYEADFLEAHAMLTGSGYEHYEVSNFSKPGHRAVHNSSYWRHVPYVGLGPSAHGFDGQRRRWNTRHYAEWVRMLDEGADPAGGHEVLDIQNRIAEDVYLGLRTTDGLELRGDAEALRARSWSRQGWVEFLTGQDHGRPDRIRCTPMGWLRLDSLAADLTAVRSRS